MASRVRTPLFRLTGNGLFVGTHRPLRYEQRELRVCAGEVQPHRGNGGFVTLLHTHMQGSHGAVG